MQDQSVMQWEARVPLAADDSRAAGVAQDGRLLLPAVGASLLLHGVLAAVLLSVSIFSLPDPILPVVQINLVPVKPQHLVSAALPEPEPDESIADINEPEQVEQRVAVIEAMPVPEAGGIELPTVTETTAPLVSNDTSQL